MDPLKWHSMLFMLIEATGGPAGQIHRPLVASGSIRGEIYLTSKSTSIRHDFFVDLQCKSEEEEKIIYLCIRATDARLRKAN